MTAHLDPGALFGARVRFTSSNDVIEGRVVRVGPHLVVVRGDDGNRWVTDRYSLRVLEEAS